MTIRQAAAAVARARARLAAPFLSIPFDSTRLKREHSLSTRRALVELFGEIFGVRIGEFLLRAVDLLVGFPASDNKIETPLALNSPQ
jgi:hypothetical protein